VSRQRSLSARPRSLSARPRARWNNIRLIRHIAHCGGWGGRLVRDGEALVLPWHA